MLQLIFNFTPSNMDDMVVLSQALATAKEQHARKDWHKDLHAEVLAEIKLRKDENEKKQNP